MKRTLLKGKYESIKVAYCDVSLVALPNGTLVVGTKDNSLILTDENFKDINNVTVGKLEYCALNHRNEIYVSCGDQNHIILFDSNLKK